jgi:thiamine kinase-like enzyme
VSDNTAARAERAARAALRRHPATRSLADAMFHVVRGGLSNHAWRAGQGGESYFVRFGGPDASRLGVDRGSEQLLLMTAAAEGLAPPVIACEPASGLLVTPFLAGGPWAREAALEPGNLRRIAACLKRLHGIPPPAQLRRVDFPLQARRLEAELHDALRGGPQGAAPGTARSGDVDDAGVVPARIRATVEAALAVLGTRSPPFTVCHNDLHHLNVIDDGGRLWLVDWEYGGIGDPLYDLASFVCQHDLPGTAVETLRAAGAVPAGAPPAAVHAACVVFDYVQWLWYRLWITLNPAAGPEYVRHAEALEHRLDRTRD